jgi:hypothetical protein
MHFTAKLFPALVAASLWSGTAYADDLSGSPASMEAQHEAAVDADYSFLRQAADVERLVKLGRLVEVKGNADYTLSKVSFPYTRPEVLSFIEHLAVEYRRIANAKLVVTSLTRPTSLQPRNAHDLSVHPAGMAVDFRMPANAEARSWLEQRLLELEQAEAIDVTRERNPPHYHVAVFADRYAPIAARLDSAWAAEKAAAESLALARARAADSLSALAATNRDRHRAPILLGLAALAGFATVGRRFRRG